MDLISDPRKSPLRPCNRRSSCRLQKYSVSASPLQLDWRGPNHFAVWFLFVVDHVLLLVLELVLILIFVLAETIPKSTS